mmetsp:Transcript_2311/g.6919  ORF Transcript_2311/g.6919 Transcript_2311/m.6919 type:complete len:584 (+) Transcript_2311:133-1884(+)
MNNALLRPYLLSMAVLAVITLPAALYLRLNPAAVDRLVAMDASGADDCGPQHQPFALRSRRVVLPNGVRDATIRISDGRIVEVLEGEPAVRTVTYRKPGSADGEVEVLLAQVPLRGAGAQGNSERDASRPSAGEHASEETLQPLESYGGLEIPFEDVGDLVIMPGLIDPHVHVNEPGRTSWEGFEHATRAAAAGGTTTILDMPLNCVPSTVTRKALKEKMQCAERRALFCDVGFIGGVIPGNDGEISKLSDAGVFAFKSFMIDSQSADFPNVSVPELRNAMATIAGIGNASVPYILHAELEGDSGSCNPGEDATLYSTYLASRPEVLETRALEEAVAGAEATGCRIHIAHLSSAEGLRTVREAKERGVKISAETCTHYLLFAAEEIEDGATLFKCAPPIRSAGNRERLWSDLNSGLTLDMVGSDHSPAPPELKRLEEGDFLSAWGGIAGLQYRLQGTWTAGRNRSLDLHNLVNLLSTQVADTFGLDKKGRIAEGYDADLVVFDPDKVIRVQESGCFQRHRRTAFTDRELVGEVRRTYVHGHLTFRDGQFSEARGALLLRRASSETVRRGRCGSKRNKGRRSKS